MYRESFPHKERDSIHKFLLHDGDEGIIYVFYDENMIVGFAALITYKNLTHILYFAIDKNLQGKGYGHACLELIKGIHPNNIIIADIEKDEVDCPNHEARERRELFYLHDAFIETNIEYTFNGVDFIIMSANGMLDKHTFIEFWDHFKNKDILGNYIIKHME